MFNRAKAEALKKEIEALHSDAKALRGEIAEMKEKLEPIRVDFKRLMQMMTDCEMHLAGYEKGAEAAYLKITASNNAEASRYIELKKRLDAYDIVFKQLGILVKQQPA